MTGAHAEEAGVRDVPVPGVRLSGGPLTSVVVVVPVHDEEELLPRCLEGLRVACREAAAGGVHVEVTVVLDDCSDDSSAIAAVAGVRVLTVAARNVGRARAAGLAALPALPGATGGRRGRRGRAPRDGIWLATTDADSVVPPHWLVRQLEYARDGADLVLGTVAVEDWTSWPARTARLYDESYRQHGPAGHRHVHGANLGIRAAVYDAVGGFAPLATGEDHALVDAVANAGGHIVRAGDLPVVTSARPRGRAPGGFSQHLHHLASVAGELTGIG